MFDLQLFKNNTAVITDRGETLTYSELQKEVDIFYTHIPSNGFLFCLCENVLASFEEMYFQNNGIK